MEPTAADQMKQSTESAIQKTIGIQGSKKHPTGTGKKKVK